MKYSQLYSELERIIPRGLSCEWDNDGDMLCLDGDRDVKKVLVTLDITLSAIEYAKNGGYDLIVSHHPLIFKPLRAINENGISARRACKLIKSDICAMSFHTRLDAVCVNDALAQRLELEEVEEFSIEGIPMGRVGVLSQEMTVEGFASYVKEKLGAAYVEYPRIEKNIRRVALLGGSGGDAISEASRLADCLVTGECGFNKAQDSAEAGFPVFVAGHYYTEDPVCEKIVKIINEVDEEIKCDIFHSNIFGVK